MTETIGVQELLADIPHEECGVFGVYAPGEDVARLTYFGLFALQHRGTESAGIATADGERITVYKDMGLVNNVFDKQSLDALRGHIGIGHVRYSTTGASEWENAQPTLGPTPSGTVAVAHNGNITNTQDLMRKVKEIYGKDLRGALGRGSSTDTAVVTALLGIIKGSLEEKACAALKLLVGAYSIIFMEENVLHAARDPQGFRPLVLGRLANGWVVASETAALDIVGATYVREVEPGEMITIDANGLRSQRFMEAKRAGCIFEYVYLARPDTTIYGKSVGAARSRMGKILARENPVAADLVIPTPDSGTPAAIGYAEESGIPFAMGLVKNAYVGRTFIQPTQAMRQMGIRLKINPVREIIQGKRLVVIDDSIVRGNTQRAMVKMLREAGASEVHVRISSPPVKWPCFFGIDFATRAELIANGIDLEEICRSIGADSLAYISLEGMVTATQVAEHEMCTACFTGHYPVAIPPDATIYGYSVPSLEGADIDTQANSYHLDLSDLLAINQ